MKERAIQNFWIVGLATLGVLALVLLRLNHESLAPIAGSRSQPIQKSALELESSVARVSPGRDQPNEVINPRAAREVGPEPALAIARVAQPASVAEPPPVARLQGHGESAVLLDRGGKPLLRATDAAPIYSAKPSPSGQQVLVGRGNGEHQIYLIEPFELVRELPLRPDGVPRASGFGSWAWVDETTLITAVDIERPATELSQLTGAERESPANWRERTLLYSFDLADGTLKKIDTARAEIPPSFTVVEVRPGGVVKVEWDEQGTARTAWLGAGGK